MVVLKHSGVEGMRWGYNDGKRNGKRTAKNKDKPMGYQPNKYTKSQMEMDDEDRAWYKAHQEGTDTRTWEEYCDDRWAREAAEEEEAKKKAEEEEARKKAEEEEEAKKNKSKNAKKKIVNNAASAAVHWYFN